MMYERKTGRLASFILIAVMAALFGVGMTGTARAEFQWGMTDTTGSAAQTTDGRRHIEMYSLPTSDNTNMRIIATGYYGNNANGTGIDSAIYYDNDGTADATNTSLIEDLGQVTLPASLGWVYKSLTTPYDWSSSTYIGVCYRNNATGTCNGDLYRGAAPATQNVLRIQGATDNIACGTAFSSLWNGSTTAYTAGSWVMKLIYVRYPTVSTSTSTIQNAQTGATISGAGYETQNQFSGGVVAYNPGWTDGISKVWLTQNNSWASPGTKVAQTITAWNDTSVTYTVAQGGLSTGTVYLWVENSDGQHNSSGYAVTLQSAGPSYTTTGTLSVTATTDTSIAIKATYTDDGNGNNTMTMEYSVAGQGSWNPMTESVNRTNKEWTATASSLTPGASYDFRATFGDADGFNGSTNPLTLNSQSTTNLGTTVGSMSKIGGTDTTLVVSAAFTGDSNTNNGCTIEVNNGGWTPLTTTKNGSAYEATATGLSALTAYDFRATFTDTNGIYGTNPATGNFSTTTACDDVVNDCLDCHAMPPAVGDHAVTAHQGDSTRYSCAVCHFDYSNMANVTSVTKWTSGHTNNYLDIYTSANINGGMRGGYYSGYRNASSIWEGKAPNSNNTCSNTYCHGTGASPIWGTGSTTCTTCHNNPPTDVGSHGEHTSGTYADTQNHSSAGANDYGCYKCHPSAQHASGPASANASAYVTIDFTNPPTQTGGTYTVGTSQGNDSRGFEWSNSTCTAAMYCHSDGRGGNAQTTPTWGTAMSGCASCHRDASNLNTLTHDEHINNTLTNLANYGCVTCHSATVSGDSTVNNKVNHVDGEKDVAMASGSYNGANCSSTACHTNGRATSPTDLNPAWGGAAIGCNGCHGTDDYYTDINGSPDYNNATYPNSHYVTAHVSAATDCIDCHNTTVDSTGAIKAASAHLNGSRDVSLVTGTWSDVTKKCTGTGTGCHDAGDSPAWGVVATCADCHMDTGAIGTEVDDYTYGSNKATINQLEWTNAGHGRLTASGTYPYTGNAAANFTDCTTNCHTTSVAHNTGTNPFRLTNADTNALCTGCHSTTTTNHHNETVVDANHVSPNAVWTFTPKCVDCHDPHGDNGGVTTGSYNAAMIHSAVNSAGSNTYGVPSGTTNVDFPTGFPGGSLTWASFVDSSSPYNGLCHVCHDAADNVNYFNKTTYTSGHNSGSACNTCHTHDKGFAGAGGSCTGCHGTGGSGVGGTNNRRDIQADFGMNSHHVNATWAGFDPITCSACHNEGNYADGSINGTYHNNGSVNLRVWTAAVGGASTDVVYGATSTANTHCLSCHNTTNNAATPYTSSGDTGTPGMYDTASGGTNSGTIADRYNAAGTTKFSKYTTTIYNVVPQINKAYSPHGNAAANQRGFTTSKKVWADDGGNVNVACMDCHNSHGSNVARAKFASYSSKVGGFSGSIMKSTSTYTPASGSSTSPSISWSASADLCWDCHLGDDVNAPKTYSNFNNVSAIEGYYDPGRWRGTDLWRSSFSYKTGQASGNGHGGQKGGHFGVSSALTQTANQTPTAISGRCTVCHDPHGVNPSKTNAKYFVPALKGTWLTSPYKEDRAPGTNGSNPTTTDGNTHGGVWISEYTGRSGDTTQWKPARFTPRFNYNNPPTVGGGYGTGRSGSTNWDLGGTGSDGYFIDDNTFGTDFTYGSGTNKAITDSANKFENFTAIQAKTISETSTLFAGLCTQCHSQTDLMNVNSSNGTDTIYVHNTVKGWYDGTKAADLFKNSMAGEHLMSYRTTSGSTANMRCTLTNGGGVEPYIMPSGYRWSVRAGNVTANLRNAGVTAATPGTATARTQSTSGYKQPSFHNFPCSKCHTAHTSKLPRLMKTNCIDVGTSTTVPKHALQTTGNAYDYATNCDQGAGNAGPASAVMMECHNLKKSNMTSGGGWNTKTGW